MKLSLSVNIIAQRKEIFPQSASGNNLHSFPKKVFQNAYMRKRKSEHSKYLGNNFNELTKLLASKNIKFNQDNLVPAALEKLGT